MNKKDVGSVQQPHSHKFKEKELIETIKKVSLEKDDILILQIDSNDLTSECKDRFCCLLDGLLPKKTKYLILPKEIDINVINIKDFNK